MRRDRCMARSLRARRSSRAAPRFLAEAACAPRINLRLPRATPSHWTSSGCSPRRPHARGELLKFHRALHVRRFRKLSNHARKSSSSASTCTNVTSSSGMRAHFRFVLMTISTRRFGGCSSTAFVRRDDQLACCRSRSSGCARGAMPMISTSQSFTASARRSLSARLYSGEPMESVWPSMLKVAFGLRWMSSPSFCSCVDRLGPQVRAVVFEERAAGHADRLVARGQRAGRRERVVERTRPGMPSRSPTPPPSPAAGWTAVDSAG